MPQDELLLTPERNPYDCSVCDSEDCSGCGTQAYLSGYEAGVAKAKQHYEQDNIRIIKGTEHTEEFDHSEEYVYLGGLKEFSEKRLDRPGLRGDALTQWTARVNAIVDILKVEMDGGFLENTAKYEDGSEEIIYSCMRAIAVQIVALIPDIEEAKKQGIKEGYSAGKVDGEYTNHKRHGKKMVKAREEAKKQERERISALIDTKKDLVHEGYHGYAGETPNPNCKGCQIEQALKGEK